MNIMIIDERGRRLCKDGFFRDFAMFGTFKDCVKSYKTLGHAQSRAKKLHALVVNIPDDFIIEAGGKIIETKDAPDKQGYVNYIHHNIQEFIVKAPAPAPAPAFAENIS